MKFYLTKLNLIIVEPAGEGLDETFRIIEIMVLCPFMIPTFNDNTFCYRLLIKAEIEFIFAIKIFSDEGIDFRLQITLIYQVGTVLINNPLSFIANRNLNV